MKALLLFYLVMHFFTCILLIRRKASNMEFVVFSILWPVVWYRILRDLWYRTRLGLKLKNRVDLD